MVSDNVFTVSLTNDKHRIQTTNIQKIAVLEFRKNRHIAKQKQIHFNVYITHNVYVNRGL